MSLDEILEEIKKDLPLVLELSDKKETKVRRIIQKSVLFPVRLYSFVTTRNRNRWLVTWEALSKKTVGEGSLFAMVCIVNTSNGRIAVLPTLSGDEPLYFIFLPHFFQRFASRMGIDKTGEDLIRRFFQYNINFSIDTQKVMISDTKYAIEATGTSTEGVALGYQLRDGGFFFKTFITYEMAKGDQIDKFKVSEERRLTKHELFINNINK